MRKYYQRRLPENPMKDYYYIQRLTGDAETLLVEYGFIDNQADARKLQNNIEDYVEGALKAIVEYAGYEYKEPSSGDDNSDYYTVKRGDSLWSIANKYNTTVAELVETNNLGSNTLQIGQVLRIPRKSTTPNENTTIYVVKRGDSLWKIANDYGVTVDVLKELNNLTTNGLQIGQQLIVPAQASDTPANEIVNSNSSSRKMSAMYIAMLLIKRLTKTPCDKQAHQIICIVFNLMRSANSVVCCYNVDIYEDLLINLTSVILVSDYSLFENVENILIENILNIEYWPAMFSTDLWIIIMRFGFLFFFFSKIHTNKFQLCFRYLSPDLRILQFSKLARLFEALIVFPCFTQCPQHIYLEMLLKRHFSLITNKNTAYAVFFYENFN